MPAPIDPAKRALIEQAIRDGAGQVSRNALAKQFGVAGSTVGKIATEAGLTDAFDRSQTQKGTRARTADLAEVRSQTSARLLRKANELLDRIDEPCEVFAFGGIENTVSTHLLGKPPSADVRNFMTAAAIALDKHVVLDKHDSDDSGGAAVDAWLRHVIGGTTPM